MFMTRLPYLTTSVYDTFALKMHKVLNIYKNVICISAMRELQLQLIYHTAKKYEFTKDDWQ